MEDLDPRNQRYFQVTEFPRWEPGKHVTIRVPPPGRAPGVAAWTSVPFQDIEALVLCGEKGYSFEDQPISNGELLHLRDGLRAVGRFVLNLRLFATTQLKVPALVGYTSERQGIEMAGADQRIARTLPERYLDFESGSGDASDRASDDADLP